MGDPERSPPGLYVGVGKAQALERNRHFDLIPRVGNLSFRLENEVEPHILVIGRNAGVALDTERVRGDEVERLAVAVGVEDHPRIVVLPDRVAVAEVGPDGRRIVLDDVGDVEVFVVVSQVGGDVDGRLGLFAGERLGEVDGPGRAAPAGIVEVAVDFDGRGDARKAERRQDVGRKDIRCVGVCGRAVDERLRAYQRGDQQGKESERQYRKGRSCRAMHSERVVTEIAQRRLRLGN